MASDEGPRALRLRLDDEDDQVRYMAASAFGTLRTAPADVVVRLQGMRSTDPSSSTRGGAEEALLAITGKPGSPPRSIEDLLRDLGSDNPQQREEAVNGIGRLGLAHAPTAGQEHVLKALVDRLLNDDYYQSRMSAALAMQRIGQAPAFVIDGLVKALDDRHLLVQAMVTSTLGSFGSKSIPALPRLRVLAADTRDPVAKSAREAIDQITRP